MRLEVVLLRFRKANLKLSQKKCCLFREQVSFLGHLVRAEGVKTDPENIKSGDAVAGAAGCHRSARFPLPVYILPPLCAKLLYH